MLSGAFAVGVALNPSLSDHLLATFLLSPDAVLDVLKSGETEE